jgi:hypothetical protein
MTLIERSNLRASGRTDNDKNARGKNGYTKLCCYLLNAIKRRRSMPLFSGRRLFSDLGCHFKNVARNSKSLPVDCNPPFQRQQSMQPYGIMKRKLHFDAYSYVTQ